MQPLDLMILGILLLAAGLLLGIREGVGPIYRGRVGEALVINELKSCVRGPFYLLNDVTIRTTGSWIPTTQIDHILVSGAGLFVIETKHYSGAIYGDPRSPVWWQDFRGKRQTIRNPVFQNHGHVKELRALLRVKSPAIHNLVIFSGSAELRSFLGENVISIQSVERYFAGLRENVLGEGAMADVVRRIEIARLPRSKEVQRYHVQAVTRYLDGAG